MTKWFSKWCKKSKITEKKLNNAITDLENNAPSSSLGSGIYKGELKLDLGPGKK